jgi:hypothetical protein
MVSFTTQIGTSRLQHLSQLSIQYFYTKPKEAKLTVQSCEALLAIEKLRSVVVYTCDHEWFSVNKTNSTAEKRYNEPVELPGILPLAKLLAKADEVIFAGRRSYARLRSSSRQRSWSVIHQRRSRCRQEQEWQSERKESVVV